MKTGRPSKRKGLKKEERREKQRKGVLAYRKTKGKHKATRDTERPLNASTTTAREQVKFYEAC